jgi:hypothetical protein
VALRFELLRRLAQSVVNRVTFHVGTIILWPAAPLARIDPRQDRAPRR